jgi:serine/threonine protein kinase
VKYYETIESAKTINLVMEHVTGKSLYTILKQQQWRRIPEKEAKVIFKQMA